MMENKIAFSLTPPFTIGQSARIPPSPKGESARSHKCESMRVNGSPFRELEGKRGNVRLQFLFITFLLFISNFSFAQNPLTKHWDYRFGTFIGDDLNALQPTNDGGIIIGGWTYSDTSGDKTEIGWG